MAEAAYAAGPALLGAPRLPSTFFRIFCSMFQRGAQTVHQGGAPKSPSPPDNAMLQNLKSEAPKSGAANFFCSVFKRGVQTAWCPKEPKAQENVRPQNLKSGPANVFFVPCFSAGTQRVQDQGPQNKKREAPKAGPQIFFVPSFGKLRGSKKRFQN